MASYKLNFIHPAMGRVLFFENIFADDDEAAKVVARARATDRPVELWRNHELLARFDAMEPGDDGGH